MSKGISTLRKIGAILLALASALAAAPSVSALTLQEEFNNQAKEYEGLFNAGKASDLANLWAEDGALETSDGTILRGRKAIKDYFQRCFDNNSKARKLQVKVKSLREPSPNTVIEEGTTFNGDNEDKARYTVVHSKGSDGWTMSWVSERDVSNRSQGVKDIDWLCGEWRSESGKGSPFTMQARFIENGHFIECTTNGADGKTNSRQIIGYNPILGTLVSFHFDSQGGIGRGQLRRVNNAWSQTCTGILPNGSICCSINTYTPQSRNSITWRSTNRTVDGISLPDAELITLKRITE